jgi:hypothetical protein
MEKTEAQLWKEQYELLLKAYTAQQKQLEQWEAGGILWTYEDVQTYASEEMGIRLSEDQAKTILEKVIGQHDADQGITWLTFRGAIKNYIY